MKVDEQVARTAHVFDVVAEGYDREALRFFPFAADKMLTFLKPKPGWRLLDVATGTGMVAQSAAQLIKPDGRVQGIDISARMLDQAFNNIQKSGLTNVDLHEMDACQLEFRNDYFDGLTCAFGVFFLPDMLAALRHWQQVLKAGAPIIFTSFTENSFAPMIDDFFARFKDITGEDPSGFRRLFTEDACHDLLSEAGYEDIEVRTESLGYHLRNADEWWEIVWNTAMRGPVMQLPADKLATFRAEHLAAVRQLETDKGLWLNIEVIFSIGRCPMND